MTGCIIFDFDGVVAEQGFRRALAAVSTRDSDKDSQSHLAQVGMRALLKSGYVVGKGSEQQFWQLFCELSGQEYSTDGAEILRRAIVQHSQIRQQILKLIAQLRDGGLTVALLSDHTDWLDQIDQLHGLRHHFDHFFNSYHLRQCKRDPLIFDRVVADIGVEPSATLFIDDNPANVERAQSRGVNGLVYTEFNRLLADLKLFDLLPGPPESALR